MKTQNQWLFEAPFPSRSNYYINPYAEQAYYSAIEGDAMARLYQGVGSTRTSKGAKIPIKGKRPKLPKIVKGVGEIKPAGSAEKGGIRQLLGRHGGPKGYPGKRVLVTYEVDSAKQIAHVRMMVLNKYGGGRWNYVGFVKVADILSLLPGRSEKFGTEVENRVRNLILRKTGKSPSKVGKHGNARGADIVWEYMI